MAPSAVDEPKQTRPEERTYPPANIYPVKETRFEKYIEPQADGYRKALEQQGSAAIVIDNGWIAHAKLETHRDNVQLTCRMQDLRLFAQDGHSNRRLG